MKVALIGLLQSGKSSIFAAIGGRMPPPGLAEVEQAVINVPDERFGYLQANYKPKKTTYATIDCLDVPGFNFADEHGRLASRRLVEKIRTTDLLVMVIRSFEDPAVPPYRGRVDPVRDLAELRTEMILCDLELVTNRIERMEKQLKKPVSDRGRYEAELALYKKLQESLESEVPAASAVKDATELDMLKSLGLLTLKPVEVVFNIAEKQLRGGFDLPELPDHAAPAVAVCAKLEHELSELDAESRAQFQAELGISEPAVKKFVRGCYTAMGLISFLTVAQGGDLRAWPIHNGTTALDAAGKVHTDIKRGFIRAEVFAFDALVELGSEKALKAAGKIRLEGKEYIVRDGDVVCFRFNV